MVEGPIEDLLLNIEAPIPPEQLKAARDFLAWMAGRWPDAKPAIQGEYNETYGELFIFIREKGHSLDVGFDHDCANVCYQEDGFERVLLDGENNLPWAMTSVVATGFLELMFGEK